ncbi:glutathione-regulated potassium-efflux system protein KefC [Salmonella enterica subsp. arizonae]|uniref:Glutathione-regulated potassium-efflux system protein KefC n=1 Tax=Salmonella enterica subsp. arizonae TaxID=59203 RepID=A0A3S4HIC2_SALER|nr:glutathione-regulated potassium-efflux system protein KefC [Salmonella enterica subsp. arizonae]
MDSHTLLQALIYLGSAALIVPIAVRFGLRFGAGVSDCGLHYRPLGAATGDGLQNLFCILRKSASC